MAALAFDTLKAANRLKAAGFEEKQASELVSTFSEGVGENIATKDDIERLENKIDAQSVMLNAKIEDNIERLENKIDAQGAMLNAKIESMGQKMTIKLGSLMVAGVAFLVLLDRFLPPV